MDRELLKLLAMRGRVEIIRALKSFPDRDFTINELARVSGVPVMTTWRAVGDLGRMGIVKAKKVGNARAVRITRDDELLRMLRLVEDTDPQKAAAKAFASRISSQTWGVECRLFGSISRGEHLPGEEVDIAVVFDETRASEQEAKSSTQAIAREIKDETNVSVVPLCISVREMARKGGLASELRDKEVIWSKRQ